MMKEFNYFRGEAYFFLLKAAVLIIFLMTYVSNSSAQNPNSDTTTTGQILTVNITSPADGTTIQGPPPCDVTVKGLVTLSSLPDTAINVLYVIDLSGSTSEFGIVPLNIPPIDVNSDGVVDAGDDFNGDGFSGDILDAEIGGALALNASLGDLEEVDAGIIAYASNSSNADVSPETGFQIFLSSPQADQQPNGTPDIEEVLRSLDSNSFRGGSIGLFTLIPQSFFGSSSNFEAALQKIIAAFDTQPKGETNIAFFLSDGFRTSGGPIEDEIAMAAAKGIVINTIGITEFSDAQELSAIAEGTGGTFIQVIDPNTLVADITKIKPVEITSVKVNGVPVSMSAAGTFSTTLSLTPGPNTISATATANDSTRVTASISVQCAVEPLIGNVEIISPQDSAVVCDDSVKVTAVTSVTGGVPPITSECSINGFPVEVINDSLFATIPIESGVNFISALCVFTDAQNNQSLSADTIQVKRAEPPICQIEIISPQDSAVVCGDSVQVT
ncbi:MAG: VWA domain-containing protein, partial [bacterium]